MFSRKATLSPTRILDVPLHMLVEPTRIVVPLPNGKVLQLFGNFEGISDADANLKAQRALAKFV